MQIVKSRQNLESSGTFFTRLAMGSLALTLMLAVEFILVLWLPGLSIKDDFATRDPVSAKVYYAMLSMFALMPAFFSRSKPHASRLFKMTPAA